MTNTLVAGMIWALGTAGLGAGAMSAAGLGAGSTPSPVAGYALAPSPLAPAGSLPPGAAVTVTLTAQDSTGQPVGNATVYLSLTSTQSVTGSASVAGTALSAAPQAFATSRDGQLAITYTTADPGCSPGGTCIPGPYPSAGSDQITAQDAESAPAVRATDSYDYSTAGPTAAGRYVFSPDPLAGPGSLVPGAKVAFFLSVTQASAVPEAGATVYLSLLSVPGGGSVTVGPGPSGGSGGCASQRLSATPRACVTDSDGQIQLVYATAVAPSGSSPPTAGQDVVTAQDAPSAPSRIGTDTYDYGEPSYSFGADPIAPTGGLGSSQSEIVSLQVTDAAGNSLSDCPVYLSLAGTGRAPAGRAEATGATASQQNPTASSSLSISPAPFETDADGRIIITYSTAPDPPSSGTDALTAQNRLSAPTASASDHYTYAPPSFSFAPNPVATAGTLAAGQSVALTLTRPPGSAPGDVYLSFWPAPGGGSASVGNQALTSAPAPFAVGADGRLALTYTAPAALPRSGLDRLIAQDAPSGPTDTAADTYSFSAGTGPAQGSQGYRLVGSDGGIFTFGSAAFFGSTGALRLARPIVGMASTPDGRGYWFVAGDGGVFSFGDAAFFGSEGGTRLAQPVVGMASTPDGQGYWLVARDGGIFAFGDAHFYGSMGGRRLTAPLVGMSASPDGNGYWLVGSDGGVFAFGDAPYRGSEGGTRLNAPIVGMAGTPTDLGYWLVAADGGLFSFGDAGYFGSASAEHLARPVVGMAPTPNGAGYWLVGQDGGIFNYGNAEFSGSEGGKALTAPIVGMAAS